LKFSAPTTPSPRREGRGTNRCGAFNSFEEFSIKISSMGHQKVYSNVMSDLFPSQMLVIIQTLRCLRVGLEK